VADFDPGPGIYNLTGNSNSKDAFIQKLDASGNFIWAKNVGSTLADQGCSINVDATGNVYTAGFFKSTGDFDPGPGVYNLTASGMDDIFFLKLDASGNFSWALKFGAGINDQGYASLTAVGGSVYASGFFGQTVDFDPGPGTWNLTSAGANDVFVIKLNEIQVLPVELLSFTAIPEDNNKIKLNWLTASEINNDYFTVERSTDANSWESATLVDGNGNTNTAIQYETWDYTPYSGISYYRLKQTDFDGQFSYSAIVAVNLSPGGEIIISNPVANELEVWSSEFRDKSELTIYNVIGERVYEQPQTLNLKPQTVDVSQLPSGIYFVNLKTPAGISTGKFVKQ
jgi:Secretion system C-terminal sorting domain